MQFSGHPLKADQAVFPRIKFVSTKTIGPLFVETHLHVTGATLKRAAKRKLRDMTLTHSRLSLIKVK